MADYRSDKGSIIRKEKQLGKCFFEENAIAARPLIVLQNIGRSAMDRFLEPKGIDGPFQHFYMPELSRENLRVFPVSCLKMKGVVRFQGAP